MESQDESTVAEELPKQHSGVTKWLHWTMAAIIIIGWIAVEYRQRFTETGSSASGTALDIHMLTGMSIAVLVIPRLYWRLTHKQPAPPAGSKLEHAAAGAAHFALYAFMIAMPITGYLGTGRALNVFGWFTIPRFDDTALFEIVVARGLGLEFEQWEIPIDIMHKQLGGEIILPLLLALHIGAALFHHFWRKDDVLRRMLPSGRNNA